MLNGETSHSSGFQTMHCGSATRDVNANGKVKSDLRTIFGEFIFSDMPTNSSDDFRWQSALVLHSSAMAGGITDVVRTALRAAVDQVQ